MPIDPPGGWPSLSRFLRRLGMFIRHIKLLSAGVIFPNALGTETLPFA